MSDGSLKRKAWQPNAWKPGESGNPAGKPIGTRNAFSKAFIGDLTVAWREYGPDVLMKVARSDPTRFLGIRCQYCAQGCGSHNRAAKSRQFRSCRLGHSH